MFLPSEENWQGKKTGIKFCRLACVVCRVLQQTTAAVQYSTTISQSYVGGVKLLGHFDYGLQSRLQPIYTIRQYM